VVLRGERISNDPDLLDNLQAWVENNYDTTLLHRNFAFPLLKKLSEEGDSLTKVIFREEIARRTESGNLTVINFLLLGKYFKDFTPDEVNHIFQNFDFKGLIDAKSRESINLLNDLVKIGVNQAKDYLRKLVIEKLKDPRSAEDLIIKNFFLLKKYFKDFTHDEVNQIFQNFDFKVLNDAKSRESMNLLNNLVKIDVNQAKDYLRKLVKEKLKDKGSAEDLINWLIYEKQMNLLNEQDLESLDLRELTIRDRDDSDKRIEIPELIGFINSLEILRIDVMYYIITLPDSIGKLVNLKELDLRYCEKLKGLPETLKNLKNLKIIILPDICDFQIPTWINDLDNLEELNLRVHILEENPLEINLKYFMNFFNESELEIFIKVIKLISQKDYQESSFIDPISESFKQKVVAVINQSDKEQVEICIYLKFYEFMGINDLLSIREDKLMIFVESFYKIIDKLEDQLLYIDGFKLANNFFEKIGKSLSPIIKKNIIKIVSQEDSELQIGDILMYNWLHMLNKDDLLELLTNRDLLFLEKIVGYEQDSGDYYGFGEEVDKAIFKCVLEIIPPLEARALKDLRSQVSKNFIFVNDDYDYYYEVKSNTIEIYENHVSELKIYNDKLKTLPESIGNLKFLISLEIENSKLEQIPESIGKLSSLESLRLKSNRLELLPNSIGNLKSLVSLDLLDNSLKHLPVSLIKLSKLKNFYFDEDPNLNISSSVKEFLNIVKKRIQL